MSNETVEVRDLRDREWIWTSKSLLFHSKVSGNTYKVYCGLASYADNNSQQAFPSVNTLATRLHMGRNTVMQGLGVLEDEGFIRVDKTKGEHNVYYLLSIEAPQKKEKQTKEIKEPSQREKDIAEVIFTFKVVNPTYKNLYGRKSQRDAVNRLIEQFRFEPLVKMVNYLEHSNSSKFAPTITTPVQLEEKMGALKAWADKERSSQKKVGKGMVSATPKS